jgi:cytochrome c oxidase subunit 3
MADTHAKHHDYHLVDPSPWPITGSVSGFITAVGAIVWMRSGEGGLDLGFVTLSGPYIFLIGMLGVLFTMFGWWRDVINEAEHQGQHTPVVQLHLRYGMILFIASEVMFFVAWFWAYFDVSLFPGDAEQVTRTALTGGHWPPAVTEDGRFKGTFDPWGLPLVNTLILLTSGTTVTWAHHALLHNDRGGLVAGLSLTVILGILFTTFQAYEYGHAAFQFSGHIYGSTFFMATGFHGFHVIVGTLFLTIVLFRALAGHFTPKQHFGFEAAAWYWHFVDVVWLFLFSGIYVWGAGTPAAGH